MADENWWNSSRNSIFGSTLCASSHVHDNIIGNNFAWPSHELLDMKSSRSNSDESIVLQELPKNNNHHQELPKNNNHHQELQMLGIGLSSSSTSSTPHDWNHTLIHGNEGTESSYPSLLQEDLNSSELGKNFSTLNQDSSRNSFEQVNHQDLLQTMNQNNSSFSNYPSSLLQTLFDDNDLPTPLQQQQQQQSFFTNNNQPMNFPLSLNYRPNLNNHLLRPSLPKQTPPNNFPFSNSTSLNNIQHNFLPSMSSQLLQSTFNDKSNHVPSVTSKSNGEDFKGTRSSSMAKKNGNNEPAFKRPRIETPSPLPTFKVRKEKLGDRITALQQLVSPFGKTDTASVLHEAIEYIKFLHDQVNVLSTPYLKNGSPPQHQQIADKVKNQESSKQDLRSRGLCLVPISSTFPVATETTTDFWTPTFGGSFR